MGKKLEDILQARELTARNAIGLEDAVRGDESGVRRFAYFLEGEVSNLAFFSPLADPVKTRMTILAKELRDLKNFMDGRASAQPKSKR